MNPIERLVPKRKSHSDPLKKTLKQTTITSYLKTPIKTKKKIKVAKIQFGDFLLDRLPNRGTIDSEDEDVIEPPRKKRRME